MPVWRPFLQPNPDVPRHTLMEWIARNFRRIGDWTAQHLSTAENPHSQYKMKQAGMVLGGSTNSFTLNSTNSKLVNYSIGAGYDGGEGQTNASAGNIIIPSNGIYSVLGNVLGLQGNSTKEEWIELRLDDGITIATIAFLDVTTDKTSTRQVFSSFLKQCTAGQTLSLYMWASAGLGTFTVANSSFEVQRVTD